MLRQFVSVVSVLLLCFAHGPLNGEGADRFALVIGNGNYATPGARLKNAGNDAQAMAKTLGRLGFQVTLKTDVERNELETTLLTFARTLTKDSVAFFFYAGHGIEIDGENYLIPTEASLREAFEAKRQCVELSYVLEALQASNSNLKICILDCCRDNPYKRSWKLNKSGSRSVGKNGSRGLARVAAPDGTVVAFSTSPGNVALDGSGENSPYTKHLIRVLETRPQDGLELIDAMRAASRFVKADTGQTPWINFESSTDEFFIVPPLDSANEVKEAVASAAGTGKNGGAAPHLGQSDTASKEARNKQTPPQDHNKRSGPNTEGLKEFLDQTNPPLLETGEISSSKLEERGGDSGAARAVGNALSKLWSSDDKTKNESPRVTKSTETPPAANHTLLIRNNCKDEGAVLHIRVNGKRLQVQPGGSILLEEPVSTTSLEYFDGKQWKGHTISSDSGVRFKHSIGNKLQSQSVEGSASILDFRVVDEDDRKTWQLSELKYPG